MSFKITEEMKQQFHADVLQATAERLDTGAKKYGDTFVGDPLDHAWEETLDLLFYLWVTRMQRGDTQQGDGHPTLHREET